ncbi:SRPBCC family protein [Solicola gregarius]|uniref:SRPBCC family protein n=1 Tax=Solicola gregarius TaxID=2908642 RepID=A0AA46YML7_9ACTN|nr:SRPBCC family protein [Solicola gregarius]UYM06749.1 SRPBCC family protein [Solicola gregarius]
MQLTHTFTVPASVDETWAAFNDLERIAPCFPGATLASVEGDEFKGSVKVKLGPISLQYNGTGQFTERDESEHRAVIEAKGKDRRGNGTAAATITARMSADGDGTAVEVDTDLSITGKPAQFGRGVIQDVSDKLLGQFVDCIAGKLGEPESAPADATAAAPDATAATATTPLVDTDADAGLSAPTRAPEPEAEAAELNLAATVGPVIAKRAAPYVIGLVVAIVLYKLIRRR